jgi:1,4-alpha-glucan branching enzyme
MNQLIPANFPGAISIAEESTTWPAVSKPVHAGGLGFSFKWNMGWMHDTLHFMNKEAFHRSRHHQDMTFGLLYAFSENYILPLSHDEVVHGKGSLINKMAGDEWQKFANLRAYYGFMWAYPGKKLLFMGGEIGQWREWNNDNDLDWYLLANPHNTGIQLLIKDLNSLYRKTPALHWFDCDSAGFEWVDADNAEQSVLTWLRWGLIQDLPVLCVANMSSSPRHDYRIGVPIEGFWAERLNTDSAIYGGSNIGNAGGVRAEYVPFHNRPYSLVLTLPPLATIILQPLGMPRAVDLTISGGKIEATCAGK